MKYILFFSFLFSGYAHADCNGVNFNFSSTSFGKVPLKLKQDGSDKTFEFGNLEFRYNGTCWETADEEDNPDPEDEDNKNLAKHYSCREIPISDTALIESDGSRLKVYGVDSNGKKIAHTYLEVKANPVTPGPNYKGEYPVEVTAYDGSSVGNIKVHIPVEKQDSADTATRDIRKNSMITDGCSVTNENEHGKKEVPPEKDIYCGWSTSKKEVFDCENKIEYVVVRDARSCTDGTVQPLFCEKTKSSTGSSCESDTSKTTLECREKWEIETAIKEKEKCTWGDEEHTFDCGGEDHTYYYGSPTCGKTGYHKEVFCSEIKAQNGFICESDNSEDNKECLKKFYEKAKTKKDKDKSKAEPTNEKKNKLPEGTNV